jgi:RNAse (barnase) inhibitor barstar
VKRSLLAELDPGGAPVREIAISRSDADLLCTAAGERGASAAQADLTGCVDKETLLTRVAEALEFPDWFGRNWDAFFDCLTDLSWLPASGHVLVLLNTAEMRRDAPEAFDTARSIMQEAAGIWAKRGQMFRVIIDVPTTRPRPGPTDRKRRKPNPALILRLLCAHS